MNLSLILPRLKCPKVLNVIIITCWVLFFFMPQMSHAQAILPFTCVDQTSYVTRSASNNGTTSLYKVNLIAQTSTLVAPLVSGGLSIRVNGIGYNAQDNFIYGAYQGNSTSSAPIATNDIVKIDSLGNVSVIDVPGLPPDMYDAGDVDGNNRLYLYDPSDTKMYRVNLGTLAVDTITLTGGGVLGSGASLSDISVSNDGTKVWGISASNGNFVTYTIAGNTGVRTLTTGYSSELSTLNFYDSRGNLFFMSDASADIYISDINTGETTLLLFGTAGTMYKTDGAQCRNASIYSNSQPPFGCEPEVGYVYTSGYDLYKINAQTGSSTLVADNFMGATGVTIDYNNLGYNPKDGYMWMHRAGSQKLVRIGSDYSIQFFPISNLPDGHSFSCGDFDTAGIFYLMNGIGSSQKTIYKVDLNPSSATYLQFLDSFVTSISFTDFNDMCVNPIDGNFYGVTSNGNLIRINPSNGVTTNLGSVSVNTSNGVPAVFMDKFGSLYFQPSNSTTMYKIPNTQNGNTTASVFLTNSASISSGDATRCFLSEFDPATLPITLTDFKGSATGCLTTLNWQTAAEENINHYDIEFSNDGKVFTKVGAKKALGRAGKYDFVYPQNAATGYYRLKIVESNNQTEFSAIISVKANCSEKEIIISPNPATDQLVINGLIKGSKINIFNQLGQKIASLTASGMSCNMAVNGYANGIYFIQITTPGGSVNNYRLLKQ